MCFRICCVYVVVLKLDLGFREEQMVSGNTEGEMRQQELFDGTQRGHRWS